MNAADMLRMQFQRLHDQFARTVNEVGVEEMDWRPKPDANSIGFLLWHVLRIWDGYLNFVDGAENLYEQGNWPERFGFDTIGRGIGGIGTGFTADDVAIVIARSGPLIDYLEALQERTKRALSTATDDSLSHTVQIPWWPDGPSTVAAVLTHIQAHSYIHLGEAYCVRGLRTKGGE
jgi:uncharacterized damage-inducible protein DinB